MLNKIFGIENNHPHFDNSRDWIEEGRRLYKEGKNGWGESLDKKNNDPMKVIIEPAKLDTGNIDNVIVPVRNFEFRPTKWEEFIGQESSKDLAKTIIIPQFKRGIKSHIILSAIRGHGKTSFLELLAKELDAHLIQRIGNTVTLESLPEIINEINRTEKTCVFFIDEIDAMEKEMIKLLNSIIESFQVSGKQIKPFLFACATINKSILVKNNPDTLDRIKHHINFTRYTVEELTQIISQVHQQLYKEENIAKETLTILANNCKHNPRTAINLLENYVVNPDISHILKVSGIVKDGLTWTDVKILNFLNECTRPVGSNVVAMKCSMSQREFETEWEPSLFEFDYIKRTPSRSITEKGKEFLQSIKEN